MIVYETQTGKRDILEFNNHELDSKITALSLSSCDNDLDFKKMMDWFQIITG